MLLEASLQFPTVLFTIALGIALVYWAFVLLGALDIDLLGGGDDLSGAGKALGELAGAGKAAGGGGEGHGHHTGDGHGHGHSHGVWSGLGLRAVPLTISVSLVLLLSWAGSLLAMHYLGAGRGAWFGALIVPGVLLASLPITALLVRPLAPVFALREGKANRDYIGHLCTVSTGRVDEQFGQATLEDGGTVLVIPVRTDRTEKLARGDRALIIDFDSERQAYVVEPVADMLGTGNVAGDLA